MLAAGRALPSVAGAATVPAPARGLAVATLAERLRNRPGIDRLLLFGRSGAIRVVAPGRMGRRERVGTLIGAGIVGGATNGRAAQTRRAGARMTPPAATLSLGLYGAETLYALPTLTAARRRPRSCSTSLGGDRKCPTTPDATDRRRPSRGARAPELPAGSCPDQRGVPASVGERAGSTICLRHGASDRLGDRAALGLCSDRAIIRARLRREEAHLALRASFQDR
jgi:hypothetical protein